MTQTRLEVQEANTSLVVTGTQGFVVTRHTVVQQWSSLGAPRSTCLDAKHTTNTSNFTLLLPRTVTQDRDTTRAMHSSTVDNG